MINLGSIPMFSGFTNALAVSIYIYYARFKSYGLKAKIGDFLNGKLVILEIGVGGGLKIIRFG